MKPNTHKDSREDRLSFFHAAGRKERLTMTKPREKTREELQTEIQDGKKKIRQFENREKMLRQKLSNGIYSVVCWYARTVVTT